MEIPIMSPEWKIEFNFKHTSLPGNMYCNILHFTKGAEIGQHGDRYPAVYSHIPDMKFQISSAVNNRDEYTEKHQIEVNKTYNIVLQQRYVSNGIYQYEVIINGQIYKSLVNNHARQFYNMKAYVSNPWTQSCIGIISDVKFTNFE